ncbi:MAG TPA: hypothetical protein G4N92_02600 [Anaerolineae bacterium]|nr:hypothetical protein [Anaerolineae bacterium]
MFKKFSRAGLMLAVTALLLSAGCVAPAVPEEETPDLNAIKTQAVETAIMQMTVEAKMMPSDTPTKEPPTITPIVTKEEQVPTATTGSSGGGGGTGGTPVPTWTPVVYGCELVNQTPWDGNQYIGANLDVIWTLKNVGAATWKTGIYYIHWLDWYDDINPVHLYHISHDVAPYETIQVGVDIVVPATPGQYRTQWAMVNDNGDNFCKFYYYVNAMPLATPTP